MFVHSAKFQLIFCNIKCCIYSAMYSDQCLYCSLYRFRYNSALFTKATINIMRKCTLRLTACALRDDINQSVYPPSLGRDIPAQIKSMTLKELSYQFLKLHRLVSPPRKYCFNIRCWKLCYLLGFLVRVTCSLCRESTCSLHY